MVLVKDAKKRATFRELRNAKLFQGLNWEDVLARKIAPTFQMAADSQTHLTNFDEEFTGEQALDSNVMPVLDSNERVLNFSFEGESWIGLGDAGLVSTCDSSEIPGVKAIQPSTVELIDTL
jgi:hypothetical protein